MSTHNPPTLWNAFVNVHVHIADHPLISKRGNATTTTTKTTATATTAMSAINKAQELCDNGGGRPGFPVPNSPYGLCGRKATLNLNAIRLPTRELGYTTFRGETFNYSSHFRIRLIVTHRDCRWSHSPFVTFRKCNYLSAWVKSPLCQGVAPNRIRFLGPAVRHESSQLYHIRCTVFSALATTVSAAAEIMFFCFVSVLHMKTSVSRQ